MLHWNILYYHKIVQNLRQLQSNLEVIKWISEGRIVQKNVLLGENLLRNGHESFW
jgi:hypothetical protein